MIETYRGVVYPDQMDHMQHMNVRWYAAKFDEATWHLFGYLGMGAQYIRSNQCGLAALEQKTRYVAEVAAGDLLYIRTVVLEFGAKTIRFLHTMYYAGTDQIVATSELLGVHMDRTLRKASPLPDFVHSRWERLTGSEGDL